MRVEEAEQAWREACAAEEIAQTAYLAAQKALDAAVAERMRAYEAMSMARKARAVLNRTRHLANGFCSEMVLKSDGRFRITRRNPCQNKAKQDGVCGVHLKARLRRAEWTAR